MSKISAKSGLVAAGLSSVIGGSVIGGALGIVRLLAALLDTEVAGSVGINAARAGLSALEEEVLPALGALTMVLIGAMVLFYMLSKKAKKK